jgi:hypothetical protein
MKFETLMLHSLFTACLLVCVLTLGAMLTSHTHTFNSAGNHAHAVVTTNAAPALRTHA